MNLSLCLSCSFAKEIVSGKGSRFLLCENSLTATLIRSTRGSQ